MAKDSSTELPVVSQHDLMDCGVAVLLSAAKYFNINADYQGVRAQVHLDSDGATLAEIGTASAKIGLHCDPIEFDELESLLTENGIFVLCTRPEAIQSGAGHFVLMRPIRRGKKVKCEIMDPAYGRLRFKPSEIAGRYHRQGLYFDAHLNRDVANTAPRQLRYGQSKELREIFIRYRPLLLWLIALSISVAALETLPSVFFGKMIDRLISKSNSTLMIAGFVLAGSIGSFIGTFQNWLSSRLEKMLELSMNGALIRRILNLDWIQFSSRRLGDYATRSAAISEFQLLAGNVLTGTVSRLFSLLFALALIWRISSTAAISALALGTFSFVLNMFSAQNRSRSSYRVSLKVAQSGSSLYELLTLKKWLSMNGSTGFFFRRWARTTKSIGKMNLQLQTLSRNWSWVRITGSALLQFVGTLLLAGIYEKGLITAGNLVTVLSLQLTVISILGSFESYQVSIQSAILAYQRLLDLFSDTHDPSIKRTSTPSFLEIIGKPIEQLEFRDLSFGYRGDLGRYVIRDLDLTLKAGTVTLIRGPSGIGKSSLLGVCSGIFAPSNGEILINGIKGVTWEEYRRLKHCAYLDQESRLFDGTILENLTLGRSVDEARVYALIEDAGLLDTLKEFPLRIRSQVSDVAKGFSGGQIQRLATIRALLSGQPFIIMDEPTSSLDEESEKRIMSLIEKNKTNRIFLIASHSDAMPAIADKIHTMKDGRLL